MPWFGWSKKSKNQRRAKRFPVNSLAAIYWDGSVNCSHVVKDVSLTGALIETNLNWAVGTQIRMSLQFLGKGGTENRGSEPVPVSDPGLESPEMRGAVNEQDVFVDVWSKVVRRTAQGLCVQFLFPGKAEAQKFRQFLESKVGEYVKDPHLLETAPSWQRTGAH
jgi:hypothetical protein